MRLRLPAALAVVALAATVSAQGDPPAAQQPTFRTGANYVRVDMYVTDDGVPVHDIRAEDVELLEDGVPQTVEDFEHVLVPVATPQDARLEPDGLQESREAARDPRARVFVIFLDTYHTQLEGSANVRQPLITFLDRVLGPEDLVALMTPQMGGSDITLGRKTTVISNLISEEWWGQRARIAEEPAEMRYRACASAYGMSAFDNNGWASQMIARRREKLTLDALEDVMVHLSGLRDERKAVVVVTEGWLLYQPDEKVASANGNARPSSPLERPMPPGPFEQTAGRDITLEQDCERDRIQLGNIDHERRLREITEEANRGNVTFYPVYARGLVAFDTPIDQEAPFQPTSAARGDDRGALFNDSRNLRVRQDSMRTLAWETDGTALINTNDLTGGLKRIADDLSSYYLLGYYSTNTRLDGRFREITVRVKRPGVRVRARRGYRGRTAEELVSSVAPIVDPGREAVTQALNSVAGLNARTSFRMRPATWSRAENGGAAGVVWLVGELDYRTRKELAWTAGAQAEVAVIGSDGREAASLTIALPAGEGSFAVRLPEDGALAPGEYGVRVRLAPETGGDLAMTDTIRLIVPDQAAAIGEAVLWRRGQTTGPRHVRTADPRFQRSERLRLEMPAAAGGTAVARLLDRAANPLQVPVTVTERTDATTGIRWVIADATLAPLAPGDYAIEVTLGDARQVTGFRIVP